MIESNRLSYQRSLLKHAMEPASLRGAWLGVDLVALSDNLRAVRQLLKPGTQIMAVVKADGYGHGAERIAEAALQSGANRLGVATVEEGVKLRRSGITSPILVWAWCRTAPTAAPSKIGSSSPSAPPRQAQVLERVAVSLAKIADVHVKVNTGMTRVGCEIHEAPQLIRYVLHSRTIRLVGVSSHLATAEAPLPEAPRPRCANSRRSRTASNCRPTA